MHICYPSVHPTERQNILFGTLNTSILQPQASPKKKKTFKEHVILAGNVSVFTIGALRLFPKQLFPLFAKAARYFRKQKIPLLSKINPDYFETLLKDRNVSDRKLVRLQAIAFLLQSPLNYQTALNAQQPSTFLYECVMSAYQIGSLFTSSVILRTCSSLVSGLLYNSGKQNDVGNTRTMDRRREWDLRRLSPLLHPARLIQKPVEKANIKHELNSFRHYVAGDLKTVFSLKPWKELFRTYRQKDTWIQPNSYFTDLAGQLTIAASLLNLASLKAPPKLQAFLGMLPVPLVLLRNVVGTKTDLVRAWQDRGDLDGKLILAAEPIRMIGTAFFISKKRFYLNSISLLAAPFSGWGFNLNTRYRRHAVDYLQGLYGLALQSPSLQASQLLAYFEKHPDDVRMLKKQTGTHGLMFIFDALKKAQMDYQQSKTPLAQVLRPIVESHEAAP